MQTILNIKACVMLISIFLLSTHVVAETADNTEVRRISQSAYLALVSHPKILMARNDVYVNQQQLNKVGSALLPRISLNAGIGREDSNNSSTRVKAGFSSLEMERRESSITLSQMLFDGFNADNLRQSQVEKVSAEKRALWHFSSEVALKAIEAHLKVASTNKALGDHLLNLKVHEKIAKDIALRVKSGKDDRARVSQISARLSLALANLEAAKSKVLSAGSDYLREVGEEPSRKLDFLGELFSMPESEAELMTTMMQDNPYLASKNEQLNAQKFIEQARQANRFPNVYLESGASWNDNLDGVSGRNSDAFIMLRMRYDLYSGGADRADERIAKYQTQTLRYERDDLYRELKQEASRAWFSYQSNSKRILFLQDYVESAQTTKVAYTKQFNIGQRSLIDLLDAENELLKAKEQLNDAQSALSLSKYQILHLQGNLLSNLSLDSLVAM